MPLLPPYLVVVTVILVVLPSVAAIRLRFALHRHLVFLEERVRRLINQAERGNQPAIVEKLETRFKEASSNLEHVNTAALIDQVYSQEKVGSISCEQIDYFCRLLPNLLLAFGLLGTFLGITMNLSALSQTISQANTSDVNSLVSELQQPLQGMGIAFITSLIGLFFSAVLTVVNFLKNTSLAKYKLISCLEDYLDNIYQPTILGDTRIDKAVDRLVFEFKDFLGRFGTTVREAVESSLGAKIQQIVDANKQASDLARQVYSGFQESSGTISRGASDFHKSANNFENAVAAMMRTTERFEHVAQTFERSQFPQKLSDATADLANTQRNFSDSASNLAESVASIKIALSEIQNYSQKLVHLGEEISSVNQTSIQVLKLHQSSQQSLGEIIPQLQQGAESYQSAVTTLDKLQQRITDRADSLDNVQVELTKLVETLKNHTEQVNRFSQKLVNLGEEISSINQTSIQVLKSHQSSQRSLSEIIPQLYQGSQSCHLAATTLDKLHKQIADKADSWSDVQVNLTKLVETLKNHTQQVNIGIESLGDCLGTKLRF